MSKPPASNPARDAVRSFVPKLIDLTEKVVYGDVWERPGLSKRDRSLITVAALVAMNRTEQPLPFSLNTVGGSKHQSCGQYPQVDFLNLPQNWNHRAH